MKISIVLGIIYGKSMMSTTMLHVLVGNMHYYVINSITFCIVLFVTTETLHHVSAFAPYYANPTDEIN